MLMMMLAMIIIIKRKQKKPIQKRIRGGREIERDREKKIPYNFYLRNVAALLSTSFPNGCSTEQILKWLMKIQKKNSMMVNQKQMKKKKTVLHDHILWSEHYCSSSDARILLRVFVTQRNARLKAIVKHKWYL